MHTNTHDSSEYFRICDVGETIVPMREYSADVYEVRSVSCEDERPKALFDRNMHIGQFPIPFQYHCLLGDWQYMPAFCLFARFLLVTHHTHFVIVG